MELKENKYYHSNGNLSIIIYEDEDGNKHNNEDNPAEIHYYYNGNIKCKKYYINGKLHREKDASIIAYYESGEIRREVFYVNGKLHREDYPADNVYFQSGKIKSICFFRKGIWFRKNNLPFYLSFHKNGILKTQQYFVDNKNFDHIKKEYYKNGKLKCKTHLCGKRIGRYDNLPSVVFYRSDKNNSKCEERYFHPKYGLHNILDASNIRYSDDGKITKKTYHEYNKKLTGKELKIRLRKEILKEIKNG